MRCAVAFWGKDAEELFPKLGRQEIGIICNLASGGTDPHVIKHVEFRQSDELHAKVYIADDRAIVASANASANGLGLEDGERAHWVEAGVELRDVVPVNA